MKIRHSILGLSLLIGLCTIQKVNAQSFKYGTDEVSWKTKSTQSLSKDFNSITVRIHGTEYLTALDIDPNYLKEAELVFAKYENKEKEGDLHLDFFIEAAEYLGAKYKSKTITNDKGKSTYHFYQGLLATPIRYELRDGARNIIAEESFYDAASPKMFNTEKFNRKGQIEALWYEARNDLIRESAKRHMQYSLDEIVALIKEQYDESYETIPFLVFGLKKAEKIKAEFVAEGVTVFQKEIADNSRVQEWNQEVYDQLEVPFLKGMKMDFTDKEQRVAYAVSGYNLAVINYFAGRYKKALDHVNKGLRAGRKSYEYGTLKKKIEAELIKINSTDKNESIVHDTKFKSGSDIKLPPFHIIQEDLPAFIDGAAKMRANRPIEQIITHSLDTFSGYIQCIVKKGLISKSESFSHIIEVTVEPIGDGEVNIFDAEKVLCILHAEGASYFVRTPIVGFIREPIFLYKQLKTSNDGKLYLLKSANHYSLPTDLTITKDEEAGYLIAYTGGKKPRLYSPLAGLKFTTGVNVPYRNIFEDCRVIKRNADNKSYQKTEESFKQLISDYNECH